MAFSQQDRHIVQWICQDILKCKQEASGYPGHVKTPEEKERHIEEYFKKEDNQLDTNLCQQGGEELQQASSELIMGQI